MTLMGGLGILLSLVFGCLLLALVAEIYYLLWWKRQKISHSNSSINNNMITHSNTSSSRIEENYSNHTKELFYLFCWNKPSQIVNHQSSNLSANQEGTNNHTDDQDDVELGLSSSKDLLLKAFGEDSVESEIMRLHNLAGPPRFLFTIKEETKEDLESDDGRSRCSRKASRTRSLSDLIVALETQTPYLSPLASPPVTKSLSPNLVACNNNYNNPLFESSVEAELFRMRSSPPPKFKFLRDAEEKLYKRLLEEAQKSGIFLQDVVVENERECNTHKDGNLIVKCDSHKGVHCSSLQVLPLASSPPPNALSSDVDKSSLHH